MPVSRAETGINGTSCQPQGKIVRKEGKAKEQKKKKRSSELEALCQPQGKIVRKEGKE